MKNICHIIIAMMLLVCNAAFAQAPGGMGPGGMGGPGGQRPDGMGPGMGMPPGGDKDQKGKAPKEKKQKKKKAPKSSLKIVNEMFLYGVALNPSDSIIYITDEQTIDSAQVDKKTKFLVNREDYSYQLKTYMDGHGQPNRTCMTIYATSIKELDAKYKKQAKYLKKNGYVIKNLPRTDFHYMAIKPSTDEDNE